MNQRHAKSSPVTGGTALLFLARDFIVELVAGQRAIAAKHDRRVAWRTYAAAALSNAEDPFNHDAQKQAAATADAMFTLEAARFTESAS